MSPCGAVITWDGRLDNRAELVSQLRDSVTIRSTDVAIVAAAYLNWGDNCFAKLIGDWALSIWNPSSRCLILSKDPMGTRHLYYSVEKNQVVWSTVLAALVLFSERTLAINQEYIAGYLSRFPALHLSPFDGIHSVPPSSVVLVRPGKHTISKYWDFDAVKRIRYRIDAEYEEHFRTVFAKAVQRRLRCDVPVLSELSGGRDSASIVCMADTIIASGTAETSRLDTISYYDDFEPNWNERPYFTKIEEKRGHTGWHINISPQEENQSKQEPLPESLNDRFLPTLGYDGRSSPQIKVCLVSQGNRVVLSGIGGDETMGGVPTPIPELEDLLARAQFKTLAHQLKLWALEKKQPWLYLFLETVRKFVPPTLMAVPKPMQPAAWLQSTFVKRHRAALTGYPRRTHVFGLLPSFQDNVCTLDELRRQCACTVLPYDPPFEKRYPYLDRDLLEFMFAIPREQLVRPTQRRFLMRRALVGIVPEEILNRKGKAFVVRAPLIAIANDWVNLVETTQNMVSCVLGIVDSELLLAVLRQGRRGEEIPTVTLMRTLRLEAWLKELRKLPIVNLGIRPNTELALQAATQS